MSKPKGALGLSWGEEAASAAARLGLSCEGWEAWEGGGGVESCADYGHDAEAFGARGRVRLFRHGAALEGVELTFRGCGGDWARLRDAVRSAFDLDTESETDVYATWASGEAVRLTRDERDDTCTLTVAGPRFGKAYAAYVLGGGLRGLASGLTPH